MAYLILSDFKKLIQTDNLLAIIGNNYTVLDQVKSSAQTEVVSYLTQKYDTSREFTDTVVWSRATTYKANNRVYLDAAAYVPATSYVVNDLTLQAGNVYICITNTAGAFDVTKWTLLGSQYSFLYATLPKPEFNFNTVYAKGDHVWWKDKTYTCVIATVVLNHTTELQYGNTANLPQQNIAPDDSINGAKYWGTGTAYSVTAGTLPTDTSKWTAGDNRNQQLVNYCIDVALYTVHSRIAPRNIPELRVKRYDDVIRWLQNAAQGKTITANLPLIQPTQGRRIRWGSEIKKVNQF